MSRLLLNKFDSLTELKVRLVNVRGLYFGNIKVLLSDCSFDNVNVKFAFCC